MKKRSDANSRQPLDLRAFFIDRNLGNRIVLNALLDAGYLAEIHDKHLPVDAPDEEWISLVGKGGWVALTKDKNIRYRAGEIAAIKRAKARIVVVRAKNLKGEEIAELLTKFADQIQQFARRQDAPFIVGMTRDGKLAPYLTSDA